MKATGWSALACASVMLAGCPQNKPAETREAVASKAVTAQIATSIAPSNGAISGVALTLDTRPVSAEISKGDRYAAVSYTHLRAHETPEHLVCRLLLEK